MHDYAPNPYAIDHQTYVTIEKSWELISSKTAKRYSIDIDVTSKINQKVFWNKVRELDICSTPQYFHEVSTSGADKTTIFDSHTITRAQKKKEQIYKDQLSFKALKQNVTGSYNIAFKVVVVKMMAPMLALQLLLLYSTKFHLQNYSVFLDLVFNAEESYTHFLLLKCSQSPNCQV